MDPITGLNTKVMPGGALNLRSFVSITDRTIIDSSLDDPIGDQIYAAGQMYADRKLSRLIGSWKNNQVCVAYDEAAGTETRDVTLELTFKPGIAKKIARSYGRSKSAMELWSRHVGSDEMIFQGFNQYAAPAGLPNSVKPIGFFGNGYGALAGIEAQASVLLDNGSFRWDILFMPPSF